MERSVAGVVLVGGQSSRMGTNKALLDYKGQSLYKHMQQLLQVSGVAQVYLSGTLPDETCIADQMVYVGPARAIANVMAHLAERHTHALFVPVDMPLLTADMLRGLMVHEGACHYQDQIFPLFLPVQPVGEHVRSVVQLAREFNAQQTVIDMNELPKFGNFNTPGEWDALNRKV